MKVIVLRMRVFRPKPEAHGVPWCVCALKWKHLCGCPGAVIFVFVFVLGGVICLCVSVIGSHPLPPCVSVH